MSEHEIRMARLDVERSVADFELAIDHLLEHVELGVDRVASITDQSKDFASKVKEFVDVDDTLARARESATELISDLRQSAESELSKMDARPLVTWGAVLVSGFALGYILARKTSIPHS